MDLNWLLENARGLRSRPPLRNTRPWPSVLAELGNVLSLRESNDTFVLDDPKPALTELDLIASRTWQRIASRLRNKRREKVWRSKAVRQRLHSCLRSPGDISFLCYGNICRSPMAELLLKRDLPDRTITSCGFHERTERSSPAMAQQVSGHFAVDLSSHRSRHVNEVLADRPVAVVFVFDPLLVERAERELPEFAKRIFPLGAIAPEGPLWMNDPYGGDAAAFETCYRDIDACIRVIAKVVEESAAHAD
jgi:protein-tyrosine phosphatase